VKKKHLIFEKWYVLSEPCGDEITVIAGNPDLHRGDVVCSNEYAFSNPEVYEVDDIGAFIISIMNHIVKVHNEWLGKWERDQIGAVSNSEAIVD